MTSRNDFAPRPDVVEGRGLAGAGSLAGIWGRVCWVGRAGREGRLSADLSECAADPGRGQSA